MKAQLKRKAKGILNNPNVTPSTRMNVHALNAGEQHGITNMIADAEVDGTWKNNQPITGGVDEEEDYLSKRRRIEELNDDEALFI